MPEAVLQTHDLWMHALGDLGLDSRLAERQLDLGAILHLAQVATAGSRESAEGGATLRHAQTFSILTLLS